MSIQNRWRRCTAFQKCKEICEQNVEDTCLVNTWNEREGNLRHLSLRKWPDLQGSLFLKGPILQGQKLNIIFVSHLASFYNKFHSSKAEGYFRSRIWRRSCAWKGKRKESTFIMFKNSISLFTQIPIKPMVRATLLIALCVMVKRYCSDMATTSPMWLLSAWNVTSRAKELNF